MQKLKKELEKERKEKKDLEEKEKEIEEKDKKIEKLREDIRARSSEYYQFILNVIKILGTDAKE